MVSKISFGKAGEIYASRYLIKKGYRIIEKNYRCRFGEIDIIAEKNNVIHFIEVKTRRSLHYGAPEESIDPKKINKLKFVSEFFLT